VATTGGGEIGEIERLALAPGEVFLRPGEAAARFYVVAAGAVEVMSDDGTVAYRYAEGRHFGPGGLSRDGTSIVTLRAAADGATTLLAIPEPRHQEIAAGAGLADNHLALLILEAADG
jgi:signal-transduction protein with cAMP-binding, CBS, and nucleotidyltransferase domain